MALHPTQPELQAAPALHTGRSVHTGRPCACHWCAAQATLADSALYVRYLRKRMLDLELAAARQTQQAAAQRHQPGASDGGGLLPTCAVARGRARPAALCPHSS